MKNYNIINVDLLTRSSYPSVLPKNIAHRIFQSISYVFHFYSNLMNNMDNCILGMYIWPLFLDSYREKKILKINANTFNR